MPSPESDRIAAALGSRAGPGADAARTADAAVVLWRQLERQLMPIIGARGVAALYARSLYLTSREHPWLDASPDTATSAMDLDALRGALATQATATALIGGAALLRTFHALLVSMVGTALTERLLRDVISPNASGTAAQDPTP